MSVWHEVHCDILKDYCHSHKGDHPSGWTLKYARDVAAAKGEKLTDGEDERVLSGVKDHQHGVKIALAGFLAGKAS